MFLGATAFEQNIGAWDVNQVTDFTSFLSGVTLDTVNYDALLTGWSGQSPLSVGEAFHGGGSKYCAVAARAIITSVPNTWTITDGGLDACSVPTVTSVTSSTTNGSYKVGDVITIQVVFDDVVYVTGTPQLTLETGATDAVVNYSSGSASNTLVFLYTIASPEITSDLDYASTTALALNGGTIKNAGLTNATLTLVTPGDPGSLGANKALIVDITAPTVTGVTSSTSNGNIGLGGVVSIQVNFSENVTVTGTPQLTLETGATDAVVNYASGSGTSTLTFTYTVAS